MVSITGTASEADRVWMRDSIFYSLWMPQQIPTDIIVYGLETFSFDEKTKFACLCSVIVSHSSSEIFQRLFLDIF